MISSLGFKGGDEFLGANIFSTIFLVGSNTHHNFLQYNSNLYTKWCVCILHITFSISQNTQNWFVTTLSFSFRITNFFFDFLRFIIFFFANKKKSTSSEHVTFTASHKLNSSFQNKNFETHSSAQHNTKSSSLVVCAVRYSWPSGV